MDVCRTVVVKLNASDDQRDALHKAAEQYLYCGTVQPNQRLLSGRQVIHSVQDRQAAGPRRVADLDEEMRVRINPPSPH